MKVNITLDLDPSHYRALIDPTGAFTSNDAADLVNAMLDGRIAWPAYVHIEAEGLHTEAHPLNASSDLQETLGHLVSAASTTVATGTPVGDMPSTRLVRALDESESLLTKLNAMQYHPHPGHKCQPAPLPDGAGNYCTLCGLACEGPAV